VGLIIHPNLDPRAGSVVLYLWSLCCVVMASYKEKFTTIVSDAEKELVQVWLETGTRVRMVCEHALNLWVL
jgi:hypothetical protein